MPADKFDRINSGDEALDRVQANVAKALDPLLPCELLRGRRIDVSMDANQIIIDHGLGREPLGWLLMTNNAPMSASGGLYEDRTLSEDGLRARFLVLRWSGFTVPVTFSLWVF